MPDYSKAKIYLIKSPNIDMIYVGETTVDLKKRFSNHKSNYKNDICYCTSRIILAAGDAYIELYEDFPCNSKSESCKREKEVIKIIGDKCINNHKYSDRKEYQKEYYEANKEEILAQNKEYRDKNKDTIKEYQKEYLAKNKDTMKEYKKEYRAKNKDTIKEYQKENYEKNRDKINAKHRARYAAKKLLLIT